MTLVAGLSGCTALDKAIVTVEPSTFHLGETVTMSFIFVNFEPTTVTVSSIDFDVYKDGQYYGNEELDPKVPGWLTGTVPPFQEVVIYSRIGYMDLPSEVGDYEIRAVFHTSIGDFSARCEFTCLP